jgi:hypothetical protein
MIRCVPVDGCRMVDLDCVDSLATSRSRIYLAFSTAQPRTAQPVLTMILFVSIIQLRPRPTEHLPYLLDAFFRYREELRTAHVKSHEYADCERDCNEVQTGGICKFGWYRHYCFDDTDGYLLCGAIIDV